MRPRTRWALREFGRDLAVYAGWLTFMTYGVPDLARAPARWAIPLFLAQTIFWAVMVYFRIKQARRWARLNVVSRRRAEMRLVAGERRP